MSRVGIVTLFHNTRNYGGILQSFALHKTVSGLGHDCEVIDIENVPMGGKYGHMSYVGPIRAFEVLWRKSFYEVAIRINKSLKKQIGERSQKFNSFTECIPHTKMYHYNELDSIDDIYDTYITGSDQVWNPGYWNHALLLDFVERRNKISYAASLGVSKYDEEEQKIIKNALKDYSHVSVREQGAKDIIQDIIGKPVVLTLDPTLLIDSWEDEMVPLPIEKPFAFLFTVKDGASHRRLVYDYCKRKGLLLVTIPYTQLHYRFSDKKYSDIQISDAGPREWLWLIKNAEYVFTDSFHGTAFSINFNKQFLSFEECISDSNVKNSQRIESLLSQLDLLDRKIGFNDSINYEQISSPIDYEQVNAKLSQLRKESLEFIKSSII